MNLNSSKQSTSFYGMFLACIIGGNVLVQSQSFQGLDTDNVLDVSGNGQVVAGNGYLWTQDNGLVEIPETNEFIGRLSYDGSYFVGEDGPLAYRWSEAKGKEYLGELTGGIDLISAVGISGNGEIIIGWHRSGNGIEAFRWTEADGIVSIFDLDGGGMRAVSADGTIVVGNRRTDGPIPLEPSIWDEVNGMRGLGWLNPTDIFGVATGISADGSTVTGISTKWVDDAYDIGFIWTEEGGMIEMGSISGELESAIPHDISGDGSIIVGVGGYGGDVNEGIAFIWDEDDGMRDLKSVLEVDLELDLEGWTLTEAFAISDNGKAIVGHGINPLGQEEAWIATVPEPAGMGLLLVGSVLLRSRKRKKLI